MNASVDRACARGIRQAIATTARLARKPDRSSQRRCGNNRLRREKQAREKISVGKRVRIAKCRRGLARCVAASAPKGRCVRAFEPARRAAAETSAPARP